MAEDNSEDIPIPFRRNTGPILEPFTNPKNTTIMAKNTPIDIIKGVSSKFGGSNAKECFTTNKYSYRTHLAKRVNPTRRVFKIHNINNKPMWSICQDCTLRLQFAAIPLPLHG